MSREYTVELHFLNGKVVTASFPAESANEAIKCAFGYSVSALACAEVAEWKELVKKHTI